MTGDNESQYESEADHDEVAFSFSNNRLVNSGKHLATRLTRCTHCRAARTICALRSRSLASRFSALVSQDETVEGFDSTAEASATRSSNPYLLMRLGVCGLELDAAGAGVGTVDLTGEVGACVG